jgi:Bardet-Biedl syndrome 2 protein
MDFVDWDEDQVHELIAGSEDFAIRVFKGEELIFDIKEAASISILKRIKRNIFAYCLSNGTFGVYQGRKRLWKQRQQGKVTAMVGMDFDIADG